MEYEAIFIVCEFDPFHRGHEYLISKAKEISNGAPVVCILSGNFTQRGECAVIDKYERAKSAVLCGADLVLSLPCVYSCACAEVFARGALQIANAVCPDGRCALLFGSETGDISSLLICAERLSSSEFKTAISDAEKSKGLARQRSEIYERLYGNADILTRPNNILGIEYIRAIKRFAPNITPLTVKRAGAPHNSESTAHDFVSASYLRKNAHKAEFFDHIPAQTHDIYKAALQNGCFPAEIKNAENIILYLLRESKKNNYADCGGGLYEMIVNCAKTASSYDDLISKASTKRYTISRIKRAVISVCLDITSGDITSCPTFTQLLACNQAGMEFLSKTKKRRTNIEIITKPANYAAREFEKEIRADDLYAFMTPNTAPFNLSFKRTPFIVKSAP